MKSYKELVEELEIGYTGTHTYNGLTNPELKDAPKLDTSSRRTKKSGRNIVGLNTWTNEYSPDAPDVLFKSSNE